MSQDQGRCYAHYVLATKCTDGFCPILNLSGSTRSSRVPYRDHQVCYSGFSPGLVDGLAGSQGCLFLYADSPVPHWRFLWFALGNVEGDLIIYQWKVLPFDLATTPRVFTNLLAPVAAPLQLSGCLMYPYIDNIFYDQVSFCQVCRAHDISLCCHFILGFIVNLAEMECGRGTNCLSMEGPPFWLSHHSQGLYQSPCSCSSSSASVGMSNVSLHRQHFFMLGFPSVRCVVLMTSVSAVTFTLGFIVNPAKMALIPS